MTGGKSELKEFQSLKHVGHVKYVNNANIEIKWYVMITIGEFTIRKVLYIEGLQHNLISDLQLVIGILLWVSFDERVWRFKT